MSIKRINPGLVEGKIRTGAKSTSNGDAIIRTGAVSAFGMSGTNVHMVVQSYPGEDGMANQREESPYYLLALSAKSPEALQEKVEEIIVELQKGAIAEKI